MAGVEEVGVRMGKVREERECVFVQNGGSSCRRVSCDETVKIEGSACERFTHAVARRAKWQDLCDVLCHPVHSNVRQRREHIRSAGPLALA